MATIDSGLQQWVDEALDLGLECFEDGDHTPFIMLRAGGERHLTDLKSADGTISEELLEAGRGLIQEFAGSGQYYVLVWDGYLTTAGKRRDAVFAEAGAASGGPGLLFAHRYKQTKSGKLSKVGKRLVAAEVTHLWIAANGEPYAAVDGPRE
ncbi:MAG: hypothetical protein NTY19_03265 [Planctomycetota bacterium]|nr:hypothetical protein [Planctomycetota bacterium]